MASAASALPTPATAPQAQSSALSSGTSNKQSAHSVPSTAPAAAPLAQQHPFTRLHVSALDSLTVYERDSVLTDQDIIDEWISRGKPQPPHADFEPAIHAFRKLHTLHRRLLADRYSQQNKTLKPYCTIDGCRHQLQGPGCEYCLLDYAADKLGEELNASPRAYHFDDSDGSDAYFE